MVAVVLQWRGRVGLFRRSQAVSHDRGRWHCITGYLEPGASAFHRAVAEIREETGLGREKLLFIDRGPILKIPDSQGMVWTVHTFAAETHDRRLKLNWEHDSFRWVRPEKVLRFDGQVTWLRDVLEAVQTDDKPVSG